MVEHNRQCLGGGRSPPVVHRAVEAVEADEEVKLDEGGRKIPVSCCF